MKGKGIDFDEIMVHLYKQESKQELLKHSGSGKVPVLVDEGASIWDSLAICEYIADAMYAPVVLRFNSYGIKVGAVEQQYMDTILQHPFMREWVDAGIKETEFIQASEV